MYVSLLNRTPKIRKRMMKIFQMV